MKHRQRRDDYPLGNLRAVSDENRTVVGDDGDRPLLDGIDALRVLRADTATRPARVPARRGGGGRATTDRLA